MADRSRRRKDNKRNEPALAAEDRRNINVTVLFCEKNLQQTFSFDSSTTVAKVKEIGSEQLLDHVRLNTVSPSDLSIDVQTSTQVYDPVRYREPETDITFLRPSSCKW